MLRIRVCKGCYTPVQTVEPIACAGCGSFDTAIRGKTEDYGDIVSRYRRCQRCNATFRSYESFTQIGEPKENETA